MVAFIVAIALVIDQFIKLSVKLGMRLYESIHITDWFYIYFTENPGMAFGMAGCTTPFSDSRSGVEDVQGMMEGPEEETNEIHSRFFLRFLSAGG